jgi:hypothetical protein
MPSARKQQRTQSHFSHNHVSQFRHETTYNNEQSTNEDTDSTTFQTQNTEIAQENKGHPPGVNEQEADGDHCPEK